MTIDLPVQETLTKDAEIRLAKRIEAGVFAEHLLAQRDACPPLSPGGGTGRRDHAAADPTARDTSLLAAASREELATVVADGRAAWSEFYLANLRMVMLIARRATAGFPVDIDDVFQEGCLGLAQAIRRWDYTRGTKFCTLAWQEITWRVREYCLRRGGDRQAPAWWLATQAQLRAQADALPGRPDSREVTERLADQNGRSAEWVAAVMAWAPPARLAVVPEAAVPTVATPGTADRPHEARLCQAGLAHVGRFERHVLIRRFGLTGATQTYRSLAATFGCSVRQIKAAETRGLERLREVLGPQLGADVLTA